jgi:hypothetical protein
MRLYGPNYLVSEVIGYSLDDQVFIPGIHGISLFANSEIHPIPNSVGIRYPPHQLSEPFSPQLK